MTDHREPNATPANEAGKATKELRRHKPERSFAPGKKLFTEGDIGKELFLISEGEVVVTKGTKEEKVELARLGAGDIVGELALLDEGRRSATVTTTKRTKAIITSQATFKEMFSHLPMWLSSIIKIIIARLKEANSIISTSNLRNRELGIARLLCLKAKRSFAEGERSHEYSFDYDECVVEIQGVTRLKAEEAVETLEDLEIRKLIGVVPIGKKKLIHVNDLYTLELFVWLLSQLEQGKIAPIQKTGELGHSILKAVQSIVQANVMNLEQERIILPAPVVDEELRNKISGYDKSMLTPLIEVGLVNKIGQKEWSINTKELKMHLDALPYMESFSRKINSDSEISSYVTAKIEKSDIEKSQVKRVQSNQELEKTLSQGEILFKEGDPGTEMFIIKTGRVKILKQEGEKLVELATIGPGSVLGEMSLLDNQPRSATAMADESLDVICINKTHLENTMKEIPDWSKEIIKIVVQRLRETTRRNYLEVLRNGIVTMTWTIQNHAQRHKTQEKENIRIPTSQLCSSACELSGLSFDDGKKVLQHLEKTKLGQIIKDGNVEYFEIDKTDIIGLLYEYQRDKRRNESPLIDKISKSAAWFASGIYDVGIREGTFDKDRCSVKIQHIKDYLGTHDTDFENTGQELLFELKKHNLIQLEEEPDRPIGQKAIYNYISYTSSQLPRLIKMLKWQKLFSLDIAEAV